MNGFISKRVLKAQLERRVREARAYQDEWKCGNGGGYLYYWACEKQALAIARNLGIELEEDKK